MFRVLIADDENSVIQSLLYSIPWKELNLKVAGTADNGTEALELARKERIDIAILDIRMPGLNGLELCDRLQKENGKIQLVIASGYAEFAYAEKAIQYGVIGYCLKPLDYTQMERFLKKAVQNLSGEEHYLSHEDLVEVLERRDENEIRKYLRPYGFYGDKVYTAVSGGRRKVDALARAGIALRIGRKQWGYLMREDPIGLLEERIYQFPEWSAIGYLPRPVSMNEIYEALEECTARSFQYFVDGENCVCGDRDEARANRWISNIQERIQARQWGAVEGILGEIEKNGRQDFTVRSSLRLCNLILTSPESYIYSLEQLVDAYETFDEMLLQLKDYLRSLGGRAESEQTFTNATFMKLMKYINDNYKDEISLTGAAEELHMNANYVSQLFKKEAGVTFVHYITQRRLEDAKKLLTTTRKPLTDIALEVGFNDTFHFIRTFKKFIGMTPGQYRANN